MHGEELENLEHHEEREKLKKVSGFVNIDILVLPLSPPFDSLAAYPSDQVAEDHQDGAQFGQDVHHALGACGRQSFGVHDWEKGGCGQERGPAATVVSDLSPLPLPVT
jgi:hypothetical protein